MSASELEWQNMHKRQPLSTGPEILEQMLSSVKDHICPIAIDFFGSKKGLGTTVAERVPTSVSIVAVCPNAEKNLRR